MSRLDAHLPSLFIALAVLAVIVFFESFAFRFPAFRRRHDRCQRLFIQSDCHLRQICSQMCPPFSRHTVPRLDSPSTDRNRLASVAYCPGCRAPWDAAGFRVSVGAGEIIFALTARVHLSELTVATPAFSPLVFLDRHCTDECNDQQARLVCTHDSSA